MGLGFVSFFMILLCLCEGRIGLGGIIVFWRGFMWVWGVFVGATIS
jgi:hypothetical protein